jgi:hypothetical protein
MQRIVYYGNWCAICYDFLGEKQFGKFIDLASVLTASASDISQKVIGTPFQPEKDGTEPDALRLKLFTGVIDWLCNTWYMAAVPPIRQLVKIWDCQDTPAKTYPPVPPYRLPGRSKGLILSFLESDLARLGSALVPDWEDHCVVIQKLIESASATGIPALDEPMSVSISSAHGDLNANNVLIWLDKLDHPFLIDFPFYQDAGHALQDFARLEVEIKFGLMDRQLDSASEGLVAQDYTFSQLPLWMEMDKHLLAPNWNEPKLTWLASGFPANVNSSLKLIQRLRSKAVAVQQRGKDESTPEFSEEYLPPLLYHTLRAVSYDSLSVFKRLFAVNSAGELIRSMNSKGF